MALQAASAAASSSPQEKISGSALQLEQHLGNVEDLWQLRKDDCHQLASDRRGLHLAPTALDFQVMFEDEDADCSDGEANAKILRCHSCPAFFMEGNNEGAVESSGEMPAAADAADDVRTLGVAKHAGPTTPTSQPTVGDHQQQRQHAGKSRAFWVHSKQVATLQMHGLDPGMKLTELLAVLDGHCGLRGQYNFVHIPHKFDEPTGRSQGFAFINLLSVSAAARLVERLDGRPFPAASGNREQLLSFSTAKSQGYAACRKQIKKYRRVQNGEHHPFATTEDGVNIIMAPPEVMLHRIGRVTE